MSDNAQMTITEFLDARIAEDEAVARAAVDSERPGAHWQWVTGQTDTPVAPGDLEEAQEYQPTISLRSVEEFPSSAGMLPAFPIGYAEEVDPGAGEHIARHDPARVLAECAAKRALLDIDFQTSELLDNHRVMASIYKGHPDYREEWAL